MRRFNCYFALSFVVVAALLGASQCMAQTTSLCDPTKMTCATDGTQTCTTLGMTTLNHDKKSIIACVKTGTANCDPVTGAGCTWKSMTGGSASTLKCYSVKDTSKLEADFPADFSTPYPNWSGPLCNSDHKPKTSLTYQQVCDAALPGSTCVSAVDVSGAAHHVGFCHYNATRGCEYPLNTAGTDGDSGVGWEDDVVSCCVMQ
jgi:hypothetical protein